jgi:hypothetical protein
MSMRSRVISSIDTDRLAGAVARPGIDPRIWISYGVLTSEPLFETEEGYQDVIADVLLLPSKIQETARVSAMYAGNGFGLYAPLHEGDEVLVVAPSGDPDHGLVITQRLWSPSDLPPAEAQLNQEDVTLVVEPDKNLRLAVKGAGNVYLTSVDGKVVLGEETATRGVVRKDDTTANGSLSLTAATVPGPPPVTTLTLTYTPPNGVPQVTAIALTPCTATGTPITLNLSGKVDSASDKVVSS